MFNKTSKVQYPDGRLNLILNEVFQSLMQFNYKEINALKIQPNKKNKILWVIFSQQIFIESMLCTKYYITHL